MKGYLPKNTEKSDPRYNKLKNQICVKCLGKEKGQKLLDSRHVFCFSNDDFPCQWNNEKCCKRFNSKKLLVEHYWTHFDGTDSFIPLQLLVQRTSSDYIRETKIDLKKDKSDIVEKFLDKCGKDGADSSGPAGGNDSDVIKKLYE